MDQIIGLVIEHYAISIYKLVLQMDKSLYHSGIFVGK